MKLKIYTSAACRCRGHSLNGTPCWDSGPSKRSDSRLTAVIAMDSVKGVISRMLYEKGTTGDKFTVFVQHVLLPAIQGTGTRVITMDNLDGHSPAVQFIKAAGHYVVFRPIHSPDFGEVEWVFNFLDLFLQAHQPLVCNTNLCEALEAALDCPSILTWVSNRFSIFDKKWLYM